MNRIFGTIDDYHAWDQTMRVKKAQFPAIDVAIIEEKSNDIRFAGLARNTAFIDTAGSRRHLTELDGVTDQTAIRAGDVFLAPEGSAVRLAWDPLGDWQACISLEFDFSIFTTYAPELVTDDFERGHLLPRHYRPLSALSTLGTLIARELDPENRRGALFAQSAIRLLAMEFALTAWTRPARAAAGRHRQDARIGRAIAYIDAHLAHDIALIDIAEAAGLSPSHLTALFQRQTGKTPYGFVIDCRLDRATALLRDTDIPIVQVALAAGFGDQQHMTRRFQARLGQTPGQVRKTR